ncbi:Uncharacterised protein [Haemophilus influenzae]|nr:hypothetical protein BVZ93_01249 [Haemophilus influenzae]PRM23838.1 hypothetical protein BVZ95_00694 [Haemophilus influenzae]PRM28965.1 hypothetical protein BVZ91_00752 [Haemophilus influenzae]CWW80335.1 Uncharacterised protein [Haemophilus influenzae]CWX77677.1 Uncharacterised protein [Haemophilus influenzae]
MLELALVVNLPDVAVRVAAPPVASIFAASSTVKSPVFAVTFTVLPEISPPILPDWLEVVTLSVPLIAEPALVVKVPFDAVKVAVLLVIFATFRLPSLAVTVAAPFVASILPLISPDLAVRLTPSSSDLMVPPEVVVRVPCSAFTVTSFLAVTLSTVKLPSFAVILTEPFSALTSPFNSPSFVDISVFVVALIVVPSVVVNLPLSAVIVTVLPEILPTARVSPVAVSATEPELDSIPPRILPV